MDKGHVINDAIVINYRKSDRDECVHFFTHIDVKSNQSRCLSDYISPTAKMVLTSKYNAWFLQTNLGATNVHGRPLNTEIRISHHKEKYSCYFLDSAHTAGSISVFIMGPLGTCLYTGKFCFYHDYLTSPCLNNLIQVNKSLEVLFMDAPYYEQPSKFSGLDPNINEIVTLIKSHPNCKIFICAEEITMDPVVAKIADAVEENVCIDSKRMETMKLLGYESVFTTDESESRIFITQKIMQNRSMRDMVIILHRYSRRQTVFHQLSRNVSRNIYNFHFYRHSNSEECFLLLSILRPEKVFLIRDAEDNSEIMSSSVLQGKHYFNKNSTMLAKNNCKIIKKTIKTNKPTSLLINEIRAILDKEKLQENRHCITHPYSNLVLISNTSSVHHDVDNTHHPADNIEDRNLVRSGQLKILSVPEINLLLCKPSEGANIEETEKSIKDKT